MDLSKEHQTRKPVGKLNPSQMSKLDRLFQELGLRDAGHKSILKGEATVMHHFVPRKNLATRWYRYNGIPFTQEQHDNEVLSRDEIIEIKGDEWYRDLMIQATKFTKVLDYKTIVEHLIGNRDNYL